MAKKSKSTTSPIENRGDRPVTVDELCQALGMVVMLTQPKTYPGILEDASIHASIIKDAVELNLHPVMIEVRKRREGC